jgi:hypothetical protein
VVAADGDELVAGGPALGTSVLAASTNTTAPAAGQPQAGWVHLGKAASPMTFSDPLGTSVLNAHWYMEGDNAQARPGSNGVQLSATGGTAALIQGAPMGDATVTAQVAMPAHAGAGTHAGLVLYLDEGDWLTLLVDGRGHVAFCGAALQQALPCASAAISGHPASGTIGLQITRTSDTYSAEMSADGVTWTTVGQISPAEVVAASAATATPTSSPSASATPRSTATPTVAATGAAGAVTMAPLAFSECGLYVEDSAPTSAAPTLAQFIVVSTGGPLSGVGG